MTASNNKLLAKNTLMLYVRMFFVMGIGLYTSRITLQALGESDFGVYSIIGGVVIMMSFLNNSLAGATQRFLSYELGKKNLKKLEDVFNACFFNHIIVALIVLVAGEVFGVWFMNTKLNIPEDRMYAANIVYQLSLITTCVNFIRIPYNAAIVANERMVVFSLVSIIEVMLKVGLVFFLLILDGDKLILYAVLLLILSLIIQLMYILYCRFTFDECKVSIKKYSWIEAKPMLTFSAWDLFGNFCFMARNQGVNILINIFFGVILNASVAIANRIQIAFEGFVGSFLMALKPRMVKIYATESYEELLFLLKNSSFYILVATFTLAALFSFNVDFLFSLWLGDVPEYASSFAAIIVWGSVVGASFTPLGIIIQASGDIKKLSFYGGGILLLTLPINYYLLRVGCSPTLLFFVNVLSQCIRGMLYLFLLKKLLPNFNIRHFVFYSHVRALLIVIVPLLCCIVLRKLFPEIIDVYYLLFSSVVLFFLTTMLLFIVDSQFRVLITNFVKKLVYGI